MNKTKNLSARVTESEYNEIAEYATDNSMKLSDYIVRSCLHNASHLNASQTTALIDIKKALNKLENGIIKKREFVEKTEDILKSHGIF